MDLVRIRLALYFEWGLPSGLLGLVLSGPSDIGGLGTCIISS